MNKLMKNEEGSIIVSVVLFISLTSLLVTGIAYLVRNQVIQFHQIQTSYEAKSLLEISEKLLINEIKNNDENNKDRSEGGKITFQNGTVTITALNEEKYELLAQLPNEYTFSTTTIILEEEEEEKNDDKESDLIDEEAEIEDMDQEKEAESQALKEAEKEESKSSKETEGESANPSSPAKEGPD